jgi:hypothetical protein
VHLAGPDGEPVAAPGLPFYRDHFNCPGIARLERLRPGRYTYTIERGPEYRRASGAIEVVAGAVVEREVVLERWIDLAAQGWYSGETHVHRSLDDMPLLLKSEDLHVAPVITVWNKRNLWAGRPLPERLLVEVEPTRVFHVLAAEDERQGGALLYFQLRQPLAFGEDGPEFPSPLLHLDEARRQPGVCIEIEKPFWWDMPTWAATGQIDAIGIANNHMNRNTMYAGEAWGRPRDAARLPPPRGNGFYTQELYYRLLNCGLRIAPSAGSASGVLPNPIGYNRAYVHLEEPFSYASWWRGLKAGRSFVTNGPILLATANGTKPGSVLVLDRPGAVTFTIEVEGNDPIEAVEVIRDGAVVERWVGTGTKARHESRPIVFERSGWCLTRVICANPETFRFASTAPFYVEVGGEAGTIHRPDVAYFLAWIDERIERLSRPELAELADPERREAVLRPHRAARRFFEQRLAQAR